MKLDSVREIKNHFLQAANTFAVGINTPQRKFPRSIGMGITKVNGQFVPAVRCYENGSPRTKSLQQVFVDLILGYSKGEAQVEYVEMPQAMPPIDTFGGDKLANQGNCRPLKIGWSIGHHSITCGSSSFFCKRDGHKEIYILSNNHVLAASNAAKVGDDILQRGAHDGGKRPDDVVAKLTAFVKIKDEHNKCDSAIALPLKGIECDVSTLPEGKYAGDYNDELEIGESVMKFGRTTGWTRGKVSAHSMDNVRVNYGSIGVKSFDNQIEVVGADRTKGGLFGLGSKTLDFSAGGDSGSGVMNSDYKGVGLLFAGGGGRTYCNDLRDVLKAMKIKTVC